MYIWNLYLSFAWNALSELEYSGLLEQQVELKCVICMQRNLPSGPQWIWGNGGIVCTKWHWNSQETIGVFLACFIPACLLDALFLEWPNQQPNQCCAFQLPTPQFMTLYGQQGECLCIIVPPLNAKLPNAKPAMPNGAWEAQQKCHMRRWGRDAWPEMYHHVFCHFMSYFKTQKAWRAAPVFRVKYSAMVNNQGSERISLNFPTCSLIEKVYAQSCWKCEAYATCWHVCVPVKGVVAKGYG